jgi:hypothetical protein
MKKKKFEIETEVSKLIYSDDKIKISKSDTNYFFELSNGITGDIAEAVAMLMKTTPDISKVWNIEIYGDIEIDPEKALYWLTGGSKEWDGLEHYKKPWCDCYIDFQMEFGTTVVSIVEKSRNLGDIKKMFIKYLNLPTLYEFALSKSYI